ncbi:MAG: hypothetical protein HRT57_00240 [Crocinitomicaceae bacterium]|nr:hypothetical protein [Crocinitomicaceae bacterium]
MIKAIALFLFVGVYHCASARDQMGSGAYLLKTELDGSLKKDQAIYKFTFSNILDNETDRKMEYSIDGNAGEVILTAEKSFELTTTPGKHKFLFYYTSDFDEFFSDSLEIKPQHKSEYSVYLVVRFIKTEAPVLHFKPVIFLYPEIETPIQVSVDIKGTNPFFYPKYDGSWECIAQPNGDLQIGEDTYNYLFWEATGKDHLDKNNLTDGFYVDGKNAISFLEKNLTLAGLTSKEKADLITFLGPLIQKNELNFVRFEFNETCNKFTELNINAVPDHIYRLYIFFSPIKEAFEVEDQNIPKINRNGFTILEWGGQLSSPITMNPTSI